MSIWHDLGDIAAEIWMWICQVSWRYWESKFLVRLVIFFVCSAFVTCQLLRTTKTHDKPLQRDFVFGVSPLCLFWTDGKNTQFTFHFCSPSQGPTWNLVNIQPDMCNSFVEIPNPNKQKHLKIWVFLLVYLRNIYPSDPLSFNETFMVSMGLPNAGECHCGFAGCFACPVCFWYLHVTGDCQIFRLHTLAKHLSLKKGSDILVLLHPVTFVDP